MSNIYKSSFAPRGNKKSYERCAVSAESAQVIVGEWIEGTVVDACGWFDEDDNLRILVADTDAGKRVTYRCTKRGSSIEYGLNP